MNKNPLHPKIKPYFPASIPVFSKHSYNKFLKTRPKHIQTLDFIRFENFDDTFESYNGLGLQLKNIAKRIKNVHTLDLAEVSHECLSLRVQKGIIKRFSRVKKISLEWTQEESKLMFTNYLYLKSLKNLRSLVLNASDQSIPPEDLKLKRLTSKFFRFLQGTQLDRIKYTFERDKSCPPRELLNFSQYPPSLKSWSLSLSDFRDKFKNIDNIEKLFNLKRLQRLEKFEMLTSLPLDLLNLLLESTNDQIRTLAFKVTLKEDPNMEKFLPMTRGLLANYQELEHLSITSDTWTDLFSINETPYSWKLKGLKIKTNVPDGEHLKKLGEFISSQQESIENLDLRLCFVKEPEAFLEEVCDFLSRFGCLKRLKKLRIDFMVQGRSEKGFFSGLEVGEKEINPLPILPLLINVVNELKDLKELSLRFVGADFSKDFEKFLQALQQKSQVLEILQINLRGYRIQKRDLEILTTTLLQLKSLDKLRIRDFVITDSGFYKHFTETIHRCSLLRFLYLEEVVTDIPDRDPQNMLDMLKNIPRKPNLTAFRCKEGADGHEAYRSCEQLRIGQIYKDCPQIEYLNLADGSYKFVLLNRWNPK